ncbi:cytochrome c oxidase assembly factor CtaG [Natronocella acetinitrilica]|uniref:Cytochrome c oxidase assembly factor CtaG n=1 Tax=Natronocella acetinitrilica TaxID=414046 RepID=A0AAE3KCP9_9GAMM|nr:cytochrome c oxidase assembly protein [Natronocella acetinitrilica]MCP1677195.1 cytochrome c oxidase assembly factor CtaG [Natronocella acetinitrilica]
MCVMRTLPALIGGAALAWSAGLWAHNPITSTGHAELAGLSGAALLLLFWVAYLLGSLRRRPPAVHAALFHATALVCALALFGPLDGWAKTSTAAHMVQHMLLMVVVAPLWVLSQPLQQLARGAGRFFATVWNALLPLVQRPMTVAYLHAAAIWFWHTPYFYRVAVENPWWHALEHACFLLTAGLFWWAVLKSSARRAPWALLAVLFTLMHTGFLGAILTFANAPLYGEARGLADQQLAGLIMWVVGGVPYLLAAGWIAHRWYRQLQRRMEVEG